MTIGNLTVLEEQNNYGQRLQAYALQSYIKKEFNATCFTFDLRRGLTNNDRYFHIFERECMDIRPKSAELLKSCDKIIIGGDQVLNYGNPLKILRFINEKSPVKKRNAFFYGAGLSESHKISPMIEAGFKPFIIKYGTREDCDNVEYEKTLDPVFLLSRQDWESVARKPKIPCENVFEYIVKHGSTSSLSIDDGANKTNLLLRNSNGPVLDPREFVWYALHASKVVTSSFHGAAFAILFEVPSITILNKTDHRIENLISMLNVKFQDDDVINYDEIRENMKSWRTSSKQFIKNCIEFTETPKTETPKANEANSKHIVSKVEIKTNEKKPPKVTPIVLEEVTTIFKNKKTRMDSPSVFEPCSYAAYSKDTFVRNRSSSGGFCAEIARKFFMNNGIVYGGAYSDDFRRVETIAVSSMNEYLEKLSGSKYNFCHLPNIQLIKNEILSGKPVLFIGSPCQIGAVKKFMNGKIPESCILCDLRCRGYSKQEKLQKLIDNAESNGRRVININFRPNHESGKVILFFDDWGNIQSADSKEFIFDSMEMCRSCEFAHGDKSEADITVGDFWENMHDRKHLGKEFMPENGCNIIFIRSAKGMNLFNSVKEQLEFRELN